jgi:hypothetical protein
VPQRRRRDGLLIRRCGRASIAGVEALVLLNGAVAGWFVGLRILRSIASSRVVWFLPPLCAIDGVNLVVALREAGLLG